MKVLHVINRIYPDYSGGTEIHVRELCHGLARRGEKTIILTQTTDPNIDQISWKIVKKANQKFYYLRLPAQTTKKRVFTALLTKQFNLLKLFISVIDKEKPEIIHFHHLLDLSPLLLVVCWFKRVPHLLDLVDYWFICPDIYLICRGSLKRCAKVCALAHPRSIIDTLIAKSNFSPLKKSYGFFKVSFHRFVWRLIINHTNTVILPISKRTAEIYHRLGYRAAAQAVKPIGVSLSFRSRNQKRQGKRIGYLGAVIEPKGVVVLIKAFTALRGKDLTLTFYGIDGLKTGQFQALTARDPRIKPLHPFDHQNLKKIFEAIDILVAPSIWEETFGITVSEAQLSGIPVIASDIGGFSERIIDGLNGFLVKPNNPLDLKRKLKYVISHYKKIDNTKIDKDMVFSLNDEVLQVNEIYQALLQKESLPNRFFNRKLTQWTT